LCSRRGSKSQGNAEALRGRDYPFKGKDEVRSFFTQLTSLIKNLNYAPRDAKEYTDYRAQIDELVKTLGRAAEAAPA